MANRYWVGVSATDNWNDTANWSTSSGGGGGASIPGSSDIAIFDSGNTNNCDIDTSVDVDGLELQSGYTGTVDCQANAVTIDSFKLQDASATFVASSGTTVIVDLFDYDAGTFTHNSGRLKFQKSGDMDIQLDADVTFYDFELNNTHDGGDLIHAGSGNPVISNQFIGTDGRVYDGTYQFTGSGTVVSLASAFGGFSSSHRARFEFIGSNNQTVTGTTLSTGILPRIKVNKTGGTLTFDNDFACTGWEFLASGGGVNNFDTDNIDVRMEFGNPMDIKSTTAVNFNDLYVKDTHASAEVSVEGTVVVKGTFYGEECTLGQVSGSKIQCHGNIDLTFDFGEKASDHDVSLEMVGAGDATLTIDESAGTSSILPKFRIDKTNATDRITVTTGSGSPVLDLRDDLTIQQGILYLNGHDLDCSSAACTFSNNDTLEIHGTESFSGTYDTNSGLTKLVSNNGFTSFATNWTGTLFDLEDARTGGIWDLNDTVVVEGDLDLTGSNQYLDDEGGELQFKGHLTIGASYGQNSASHDGWLSFTGTTGKNVTFNSGGRIPSLRINGSGTLTFLNDIVIVGSLRKSTANYDFSTNTVEVEFTYRDSDIISDSGDFTLYNFHQSNTSNTYELRPQGSIVVSNTALFTIGQISNDLTGSIACQGAVTIGASYGSTTASEHNGFLKFTGGSNQTITCSGGIVPNLEIDKSANTATLSGANLEVFGTLTVTSGGFDMATTAVQAMGWTQTGGTLDLTSGLFELRNTSGGVAVSITGTPTVNHNNGSVKFGTAQNATADFTGGLTLYDMTVDNGYGGGNNIWTITEDVIVSNSVTFTEGKLNLGTNGNIRITGATITIGDSFGNSVIADVDHDCLVTFEGSATQNISGAVGWLPAVTFNKSGGALVLGSNVISVGHVTYTAGTITTGAYRWVLGSGRSPTFSPNGMTLGALEMNTTSGGGMNEYNVDSICNVTDFYHTDGDLDSAGGKIVVSGDFYVDEGAGSVSTDNDCLVELAGSNKNLYFTGNTFGGIISKLQFSGGLYTATDSTGDNSAKIQLFDDLTIDIGATFFINLIDLDCSSAQCTFSNNGTLQLMGQEEFSGTYDTNSGLTKFVGTGSQEITNGFATMYHVEFTSTGTGSFDSGGQDTFTMQDMTISANSTFNIDTSNLTVNGTISNNGTLKMAGGQAMSFAGAWDSNSGTLLIDAQPSDHPTLQSAFGTAVYNLTLTGTNIAGLSFQDQNMSINGTFECNQIGTALDIQFRALRTYTINTWNISGTSGNIVTLSRQGGTGSDQWDLNVTTQTGSTSDYVNVSNSDATPGIDMTAGVGSTDGGNNTAWNFPFAGIEVLRRRRSEKY